MKGSGCGNENPACRIHHLIQAGAVGAGFVERDAAVVSKPIRRFRQSSSLRSMLSLQISRGGLSNSSHVGAFGLNEIIHIVGIHKRRRHNRCLLVISAFAATPGCWTAAGEPPAGETPSTGPISLLAETLLVCALVSAFFVADGNWLETSAEDAVRTALGSKPLRSPACPPHSGRSGKKSGITVAPGFGTPLHRELILTLVDLTSRKTGLQIVSFPFVLVNRRGPKRMRKRLFSRPFFLDFCQYGCRRLPSSR